ASFVRIGRYGGTSAGVWGRRSMRASDVRRTIRHARRSLSVRRWPLQRKIAIGVWIPVVVVAVAMFTGPNRSVGARPSRAGAEVVLPKHLPTTTVALPNLPQPAIGKWVTKNRRAHSSAGSAAGVQARAGLHFEIGKVRGQQAATATVRKRAAARA